MIFRAATIISFLAVAATAELCYDGYAEDFELELGPEDCKPKEILKPLRAQFKKYRNQLGRIKKCTVDNDLEVLLGIDDVEDATETIVKMCSKALADTSHEVLGSSDWGIVEDADVDLEEFFSGHGFLNEETGNFQQDEAEFEKRGGYDKFIYIGEDPRYNDHYKTTEESYLAGQAIKELYEEDSLTTYMSKPTDSFHCESNVAMCCWHRDRQYFDNNGNCGHTDCANQDPGDNTDLCWVEDGGEIFPYPKDDTEKNLHCHGIAWSNLGEKEDINTDAKYNSLFYVSLYDHLFKRGYAESLTNDPNIAGDVPMCGCVEDMPAVARADCNEVVGKASFTVTVDKASSKLVIKALEDTFELKNQACKGIEYKDGFEPGDQYDIDSRGELSGTQNDLSAFVFRSYLEGKMTLEQTEIYEQTVVGYKNPEIQNDDDARESECRRQFNNRYPDLDYKVVPLDEVDV